MIHPHLSHRDIRQRRGAGGKDRQRPVDRHLRCASRRDRGAEGPRRGACAAIRPLPDAPSSGHPFLKRATAPFNRADVDIAFPLDAIGTDLAALMTIAIGGVYSIKGLTGIRIVDMKLPRGNIAAPIPARNSASPAAAG